MRKTGGRFLLLGMLLWLPFVVQADHKTLHVVFISPGHASSDNPTGHFWPEASEFANAVAEDLGINLEILYGQRDSFRMQRLLKQVIERQEKPDYLLLVNERFALTPLFEELDSAKLPFFLAYNHHSKGTLEQQPKPRKHHKHWLGALLPDNEYAGFRLAELLIQANDSGPVNILAFQGDNVTSAAVLRARGLRLVLKQFPRARLVYSISGEWSYDIPHKHTAGLLRRYPQVNAIWAANGAMALGAINAMESIEANSSLPVASINWDVTEIEALQQEKLYASVGGHFMTAGWSLILLHDYHHGLDFVFDGGAYQQRRLFDALTRENVQQYLPLLQRPDWRALNFKRLSKHYNSELERYRFSVMDLK